MGVKEDTGSLDNGSPGSMQHPLNAKANTWNTFPSNP